MPVRRRARTTPPPAVKAGGVSLGGGRLFLIAGPCVLEGRALAFEVARHLARICRRLGIAYVFKASFDKANRGSAGSFRGPGLAAGLELLSAVRRELGVPVLTDVHWPEQAAAVAAAVDVLQVPAFLCRQTDLLVACARTGRPVNVKKGQFMAPEDMRGAVEKIRSAGSGGVLLTERGTTFGYHNLVVDMRGFATMKALGCPAVFDATHSVQLPGAGRGGACSGGERAFVPALARAALAAGADGLFIETHPDPAKAFSDRETQWPLGELGPLLDRLLAIDRVVK